MTLHRNARTCPKSRPLLVDRVIQHRWSVRDAAVAAGVSDRTVRKWVKRFREDGDCGLLDRSSAPTRTPHKTPADREATVLSLRDLRFTAAEIAEVLGMPHSTVSAVLKRHGRGRLRRIDAD